MHIYVPHEKSVINHTRRSNIHIFLDILLNKYGYHTVDIVFNIHGCIDLTFLHSLTKYNQPQQLLYMLLPDMY